MHRVTLCRVKTNEAEEIRPFHGVRHFEDCHETDIITTSCYQRQGMVQTSKAAATLVEKMSGLGSLTLNGRLFCPPREKYGWYEHRFTGHIFQSTELKNAKTRLYSWLIVN